MLFCGDAPPSPPNKSQDCNATTNRPPPIEIDYWSPNSPLGTELIFPIDNGKTSTHRYRGRRTENVLLDRAYIRAYEKLMYGDS